MGKVKLGVHEETGHTVAVKIIPRYPVHLMRKPHEPVREGMVDAEYDAQRDIRIIREAYVLRLLNHPGVVKLLDFVVTESHYYLVFEYVHGRQFLDWVVQNGRMHEDQARTCMKQILSSLEYCHQNGLVHRDLKIENILVDEVEAPIRRQSAPEERRRLPKNLHVKILDFGLSQIYRPDKLLSTFCGSLYFAAPELLRAKPYNGPEVDLWSCGVIAFVLLVGQVPFDDPNIAVLHQKIKGGRIRYPSWLSPSATDFLRRMLVVDPTKRATVQELLSHPWINENLMQSPTDESSPSFLASLTDRLRNMTFGNHGTKGSAETTATLLPGAPPPSPALPPCTLLDLPGSHPDQFILDILKRDPEDCTKLSDESNPDIFYTTDDGALYPPIPRRTDLIMCSKNKTVRLSHPAQFGFGRGFGFDVSEVDEHVSMALEGGVPGNASPVIRMYRLLFDYFHKERSLKIAALRKSVSNVLKPVPIIEKPLRVIPVKLPERVSVSKDVAVMQCQEQNPKQVRENMRRVLKEEGFDSRETKNPWVLMCRWQPSVTTDADDLVEKVEFSVEVIQGRNENVTQTGLFVTLSSGHNEQQVSMWLHLLERLSSRC